MTEEYEWLYFDVDGWGKLKGKNVWHKARLLPEDDDDPFGIDHVHIKCPSVNRTGVGIGETFKAHCVEFTKIPPKTGKRCGRCKPYANRRQPQQNSR